MPRLPIAVRLESEQIEWLRAQAPTITEAVENIVNNAIAGQTEQKEYDVQFDLTHEEKILIIDNIELIMPEAENYSALAKIALESFITERKLEAEKPNNEVESESELLQKIEALEAEIANMGDTPQNTQSIENDYKQVEDLKIQLDNCKQANIEFKNVNHELSKNIFELEQRIGSQPDYSEYILKVENGLKHLASEVERITGNWSIQIITAQKSQELFNIGFDGTSSN